MKQWKITLRTSMILWVLMVTLCFPGAAFAEDQAHVFVNPEAIIVTTCGTQTVEVRVEDVENLTGYHLEIGFDPNVIEVTNVVNGGFLAPLDEIALYEPTNDIDNDNGLITFGMVQQGDGSGDPNPKTGDGVLIEITFQALVPNETSDITIIPSDEDEDHSILVNWPDAFEIPFTTADGFVSTVSCDIALTGYDVQENEPVGTEIGSFFTIDPDLPNDYFTYTLDPGVDNNDSFEIDGSSLRTKEVFNYEEQKIYRIRVRSTDLSGETLEKAFLIFVRDVNDPPVADDQSVFTTQETQINITLTGSDEDGDALTYEIVSGPTDGVLSGTAPNLTYTPGDDFFGDDSFTFRVFDGEDYSEPATVTIFVDEKKGTDYYFPIFVN
jgi:hypothetical protein